MSTGWQKIHNFQACKILDYNTYEVINSFKAAGEVVFNFNAELVEQMSGPSFAPIETEVNRFTTDATLKIGEYGREVLNSIVGSTNQEYAITNGLIADTENRVGSLVLSGNALINSLALSTTLTNIKSGLYRLVVTDATAGTVQVQALSSPDLLVSEYSNFDTSLVTTVTIASGATLDLGIGVNAVCASTVTLSGLTNGDATTFRVFSPGQEAESSSIGSLDTRVPKVKILVLSRNFSDQRWSEILLENAIFPSAQFMFTDEISQNEITGKAIFDDTTKQVASFLSYRKN